jgi:hypothetical protein
MGLLLTRSGIINKSEYEVAEVLKSYLSETFAQLKKKTEIQQLPIRHIFLNVASFSLLFAARILKTICLLRRGYFCKQCVLQIVKG